MYFRHLSIAFALVILMALGAAAQTAPPVLNPIGAQSSDEGVNLNFGVTTSDADATIPTLTTSTLPGTATFNDNLNGTGTFDWTPTFADSGTYQVTFYANDAVTADIDSELVTITVTNVLQSPVVSGIPDQSVAEGSTTFAPINLDDYVTDADNLDSEISWSYSGNSALTVSIVSRVATISIPSADWNGAETITLTATDPDLQADSDPALFTVTAVNDLPVLAPIGPQSIFENAGFILGTSASDADGDTPVMSSSTLPGAATYTDNGNGTGTFDWTPTFSDSGTYLVTFYAADSAFPLVIDSEQVTITVTNVNQDPILAAIGAQATSENVNLNFGTSASDPDGNTPVLTSSALPGTATYIDNGNGTGSFDWTPAFADSGTYNVTFYAADSAFPLVIDSEQVTITVNNVLQPPVVADIPDQSVAEGSTTFAPINLDDYVTDADNLDSEISWSYSGNSALTVSIVSRVATISIPSADWNGAETITLTATDPDLQADSDPALFTVTAVNDNPILAPIGAQSTDENVNLNFGTSASDADGNTPVLSSSALPGTATYIDNGNGTGTFDWTPTYIESGVFNVTFYAADSAFPLVIDSEQVVITVTDAGNQAPVLATIGARAVTEGNTLAFVISAADAEGIPTISANNLPSGATLVDNLDGTADFSWTPGFLESGSYNVTFFATDDSGSIDGELVTITVNDAGNQLPVLAAIGAQVTLENVNLSFGLSSTDAESTPGLSTSTLPTGASFVDNGDGSGSFNWTPTFTQSGIYNISFYATDDSAAVDSEQVTITVNEPGNQAPVLTSIGAQSTTENIQLTFGVTSSDAEGTSPVLATSTLPSGAVFTDNGDGTGDFDWTPDFLQSGIYNISFYATDDSAAVDSEQVTITVNEAGNQLPVLTAIGAQLTTENVLLSFSVIASDIESTPVLTTSTLPTGATFIDNGDGSGDFDWTPDFLQSGIYNVTFYATDDSAAVDSEQVTITVNEAGNQQPTLVAIGAQGTTENVLLNFSVSASDIESTPVLTTSALPSGASFVDNTDGTGSFDWTPGFLQSGIYNVTFYATDDSAAVDSEQVTITINEAGNQLPVLAAIGSQLGTENVNLAFGVSASDDESTAALTSSALPTGATFVDNLDGTGTFDWTPGFTDAGLYNVTFYATDDSAAVDSEQVAITIAEAGNQTPVLAAIGAQATTENVNLNFGVSASDADATIPTLTTSTLPTGATFVDNGDGTGDFDWTPTFLQSGSYQVMFYATDASAAADSEQVIITVNEAGNQLPILTAIGAQNVTEGVNLNFGLSASDIESTPSFSSTALPTGATLTDNGDGSATFDWTPVFVQSGVHNVTFYATDDSAAVDSEQVTITVNEAGNQTPVLTTIGSQVVLEGISLNLPLTASDADSTIPALFSSTLPSGATFLDNGDGTADFDWLPDYTQSGVYVVLFYTSDGTVDDSEFVTITVTDAGNQNPVLAAIGAQAGTENSLLTFSVSATDGESVPSLSTSTLPTGAAFVDNGDGSGDFNWTPGFTDAGVYPVTFYATDDSAAVDSEQVAITINEVGNQSPSLAAIGAQSTTEDVNLNFSVTATDPDATIPAMTTSTLPTGATFVDNGDGSGTFDWTPGFTDAGAYNVTFYADDGALIDSEQVVITVNEAGNQSPLLAAIGAQSTTETVNLNFGINASDPDATIPSLTTSTLPTGATFVDNGDGSGTFDWTPTFTDAGIYNVTFYADDGALIDSEQVVITVNEVGNQLPVLAAIGAQNTSEGVNLNFGTSASDADGDTPVLTASTLPGTATYIDNGNGTGTFDWTPTSNDSGTYNVTFYAADSAFPLVIDSEQVTITVTNVNQDPVLAAIGAQATSENVNLNFGTSASDADGNTPVLSSSTLPGTATYIDNGNGTGTFDWTPTSNDSGTYNVTFYAADSAFPLVIDSEQVTITVNNVNQDPVLAAIGAQATSENVNLNFGTSASDADGDTPVLSSSALPGTATYIDNGNGTGTFDWTPTYADSGTYNVTFYAADSAFPLVIDSEQVTITVTNVNQDPVLAAIGAQNVAEGGTLLFSPSSSDADGDIPVMTSSALPGTATYIDNGDGTGSFAWSPSFLEGGTYPVTFYATDGVFPSSIDSEQVVITVTEAGNQSPVLAAIGPRSTTEDVNLNFGVTASDPDATIPALSTSTLPTGATFADNGDGSGTFDWTPGFTDAGTHNVTFYADDGALIDSEQVVITVNEAGNQSPVLAAIGAQSITETVNLNFGINASDPDATIPGLTTSTLPTGATFADNGDGSGTFDWTPGFTDAGAYNVTFYADDGALIDSEQVVITVNEVGNQSPVLAAIGPRSTTETVNLNFGVSATDPDATIPALSTSTLPTGATFVDNGDGSGTFDWTPGFTDAGTHNVTFYADDGALIDSEQVVITVNEIGNQPPQLDPIGPQVTTENINLNFTVTASDPDATIPNLTTSALPSGASFVDNGDGSGTFDWTPDFTQASVYNITFFADDGSFIHSEVVAITVNEAGNQSPLLTAIGAQSTTEDVNLSFGVTATDPDATIPTLTTSTLPTGASFVDNGDGSGSFDWTPGFLDAGVYNVTFYADDGALIDSEQVAITVNEAGNQSPLLAAIGAQSTTETVNLNFGINASDPDATIPSLTTSTLPTGATFVDNGDGSGTFDWTPGFTDAGTYNVTFYADDGALIDSEQVVITVNEVGNQSPVLAAIGAQSTTEAVNLNFGISASDPDATIPSLTTSTLPTGATFVDNGDGSGTFDWTPHFANAGIYNVTFYADDGALIDSEQVVITVNEAGNQPPTLDPIGPQVTTENVNLNFIVTATDPDSTIPALSTSALPAGASFVDNGDGSGTFDWTPGFTQAGPHNVTFFADDGSFIHSEVVTITVNEAGNQSPLLAAIGAQSTFEDVNLNFGVTATDPDATIPALSTSTLPTGAGFVDNGDGSGTFDWTPGFTDAGTYNITFYADDGALIDSEQVVITVIESGNQSPVLAAIGAQSTTETVNLNFAVTATDPDATIPALSSSTVPTGATFVDNGDGSGTFDWTPGFTDAGTYNVTFYADDGALIDSEQVVITVNEVGNQSPLLAAIGAQSTTEDVNLNFGVNASDPDATIPGLTTSTLPTGATFVDNGDGSGTFDWTPGFTDAGTYNVTFYADDGALIDSEQVVITVNEAGNQAPLLATIGAQSTTEDINLNFVINASDPDATIPSLTTSTLPTGATFVDNGDGSGSFDWTPGFTDAAVYNVTFYADDGALIDSEQVVITVNEAGNQSPVLAAIGAQSTTEDINLNFGITASDPDATIPSLTTSTLPTGASFVDNGDGSGTFDWTPIFTDAGTYNVTFYADDGALIDSEQVVITVNEAGNQSPVLATIGPRSTTENVLLNFGVSASDVDATIPALSTSTLPTGATFVDNGDGSGAFDWIPTFTDAGTYNVTFYADDGALIDSEQVVITINEAGNQPPTLDPIGPQATTENVNLNFTVTASDPDATIPNLTTSALPSGATFVDNGDGSGTFDWTPDFTQAGPYNVTFFADDGSFIHSEVVAITVNEAGNQSPVLAAIGPHFTTEGIPLNIPVGATDPDGTIPALSASTLPIGASFVDNGDGTGDFDWTPGFTDASIYNVTFYADDGGLTDSEQVVITVNEAGNQSPILAAIGAQSTTETVNLNFGINASDPDATIPSLTTSTLPTGATFVDNGDGSGTFDWTPGFTDAGTYNVTFYADDGALIDSEQVVITVNDVGNQSPVLAAIGPQATDENVNLSFGVSATDPDATIPALSTSTLPFGAGFIDNGDGSGSFDWTPDFDQAGVYVITFYATDGVLIDSEQVQIVVTDINRGPTADAGSDQFNVPVGSLVTLDGTFSSDPDGDLLNYNWLQIGGTAVVLSNNADSMPTFTPPVTDTYLFELTVNDGLLPSTPDTVSIDVVNVAPPVAVSDLAIQINADAVDLTWSLSVLDTAGFATSVDRYVISRGTAAYFTPLPGDSIGFTDNLTSAFTDADLAGANVVGDTLTQYFYVVEVVDIYGNRSTLSNRVGEYDYQLVTTATTNYNLVGIPFSNTGIVDADALIAAIGSGNVLTVNNFIAASQSYEARFAAGFGTNFAITIGGVYQVNSATDTIFSVAGSIPDSGTVSYSIQTSPTTDFNFLMIPFELEGNFTVAQDLLDSIPGVLNTLNNFVAGSQSYQSRFAAGFGTNFPVKAGKPYQGNAATDGVFPGP